MSLFGFIREAFDREAEAVPAPAPVIITALPPHDPLTRLLAQSLVRGLTTVCDVSYDEAWMRLFHLPIHSVALLDSPPGGSPWLSRWVFLLV